MSRRPLSDLQIRVLKNLAAGRPIAEGIHQPSRSHHGGFTRVLASLTRRGLITHGRPAEATIHITQEGLLASQIPAAFDRKSR